MKLQNKVITYASPRAGLVAYENSYYTRPDGVEKMRLRMFEVANDLMDDGLHSFSDDNGQTWPESRPCVLGEQRPNGMLRRLETTGFVDPINGRLLHLVNEGVLPNDTSEDAMTQYSLKYRVSDDGGKTILVEEPLVQRDEEYSPSHPVEQVWVGKNALATGGENAILRAPQGHLVLGTNFTPIGKSGRYEKPDNVWNTAQILVLFGYWQSDGRIEWEGGPVISLNAEYSTRGVGEPSVLCFSDGRILMIIRGGNDGRPEIPGYKWHCVSDDGGKSWSEVSPWKYSDGASFFSPGSVSQLLSHSNGKYFFLGNICPHNSQGNAPRFPLVIGEIDPASLMLMRDTVFEIDTLQVGEHPTLALSNFSAHEDRLTSELILHCTRMFTPASGWHGDAYQYRIEV